MTTTLLQSKFHLPPLPPDHLRRPILTARLRDCLSRRLTLIAAPAGYGKTALVEESSEQGTQSDERDLPHRSFAERRARFAFLSLDVYDNDPATFVAYVFGALAPFLPALDPGVVGMLRAPQPPPLDRIWTPLLNAAQEAEQPLVLVLDDYHVIAEAALHDTISYLVEHLPPQLRLVLVTRNDPPLPLARWRARGDLSELRAVDLRLSPEESAAWLRAALPYALPERAGAALWQRIEGWPAALRLAGSTLRGYAAAGESAVAEATAFIEAFSGSHHIVHDFLLEEVLRQTDPETLQFLLRISILERVNDSLAQAVSADPQASQILRRIHAAGLFLQPLDPEQSWFRLQRLIGDLLHQRLRDTAPDEVPALHRRAAEWHAAYDQSAAALSHYLAGGAAEAAAELLANRAMGFLETGQTQLLLTWLYRLPVELRRERPWLRIYQAWALLLSGAGGEAALLLTEIGARNHLTAAQQGHVAAQSGYLAGMQGDVALARRETARARRLLPADSISLRAIVSWIEGGMHLLTGNDTAAAEALTQAATLGRSANNLHVGVPALRALGDLAQRQGRLQDAQRLYETARDAAEAAGLAPLTAGARRGLGQLALERERLDEAAAHFDAARRLGELWGQPEVALAARLGLARVAATAGDAAAARETLRAVETALSAPDLPLPSRVGGGAAAVEIWLQLDDGAGLARVAALCRLSEWHQPHPLLEAAPLALAGIALQQGELDEADALAQRVVEAATGRGLTALRLAALARRAQIAARAGRGGEAARLRAEVRAVGEPAGFRRTLRDAEGDPGTRRASAALREPLTPRELDVLKLMADGHTNKGIARDLVIALGTVKAHTAGIYGKLGVHNRTQAVARARELGLLEG